MPGGAGRAIAPAAGSSGRAGRALGDGQRRALATHLVLLRGRIDGWDGTTNIVAERIDVIRTGFRMPSAHDWR